jgi:predicted ester cyclase
MTLQQNKDLVRRLYEGLMTKGDNSVADAVVAPDYVDHDMPGFDRPAGREELKMLVAGVRAAFPDIKPALHELIAEGDWVSVRVEARGTHSGAPFMGVKATGKSIVWKEIHHYRIAGGAIAEHRGIFDLLAILMQLGAVSLPTP